MKPQILIITSFFYGVVLSLLFIYISRSLVKPRRTAGKTIEYESGVNPLPSRIVYFARRYFLFIIAYVVFDVIASFLIIIGALNPPGHVFLSYLAFTAPPALTLFAAYHLGYLRWR